MPPTPEPIRPRPRRTDGPEPLRRKRIQPAPRSPLWRRVLNSLLVFAIVVLLADALVGDRGLVATTRARQQSGELTSTLERLRHENGELREAARRLREDPGTIEALARKDLGLIRPGEVLVYIKDLKSASK
jgi:cell division protein FtsB